MLDCYVYAAFSIVMYVLRLPSWGGRQNRQVFFKKILCSSVMFISSPMYIIYVP
jgi:hypothetical protein